MCRYFSWHFFEHVGNTLLLFIHLLMLSLSFMDSLFTYYNSGENLAKAHLSPPSNLFNEYLTQPFTGLEMDLTGAKREFKKKKERKKMDTQIDRHPGIRLTVL